MTCLPKATRRPLVPLTSRSEYDPRALAVSPLRVTASRLPGGPPMRYLGSPALPVSGSDPHRTYLIRLCCALGVSHTLDALFRPLPCGLVSCHTRSRALDLQRFPLSVHRPGLSTRPTLHAVAPSPHPKVVRRPRLRGRERPVSPFIAVRCYPRSTSRASPGLSSPRYSPGGLGLLLPGGLLSWAFGSRWRPKMPSTSVLYRVSENRRLAGLFRGCLPP